MDILIFFSAYLIFLFLQAIFINGVYISAHGTSEELPNGGTKESEMILYPLYKFLTQSTKMEIYYSGEKWENLKSTLGKINRDIKEVGLTGFSIPDSDLPTVLKMLKAIFDNDIKAKSQNEIVFFYKEYEKYRFSKYIRKPIIQCIICMASFWGFFTYWPLVYHLYGVNYFTVAVWIANTFCLSFVNFLIFKKK